MKQRSAIKVNNVSKSFRLPYEKNTSLKSLLINAFKPKRYHKQQVLKNINLEVKKGEFFGIVGRNGSGKSTLLKLLAGIYVPNKGLIDINGKLTPFIELGVGFNPELTGRENVFLNGALLGFTRKEMMKLYDDIVAFAELEKFMDQKLKNYSSGMQVRLAFSIAIRVESDILLLDEVLAVGDEAFQRKCYKYFHNTKKRGKTVVIVTHDMNVVREFCDRATLIHDSEILSTGKPNKIAEEYGRLNSDGDFDSTKIDEKRWGDGKAKITSVTTYEKDKKVNKFKYNSMIKVQIKASAYDTLPDPTIGIIVADQAGRPVYATNSKQAKHSIGTLNKGDKLVFSFDFENILNDGEYVISCAVNSKDRSETHSRVEEFASFSVYGRPFPHSIAHPSYKVDSKII